MLGFLDMVYDYELRNIKNTKEDYYEVDTSIVTDCTPPYETAIKLKGFNNFEWIIVSRVSSVEKAYFEHDKWVKMCKKNNINHVVDVSTGEVYNKEEEDK